MANKYYICFQMHRCRVHDGEITRSPYEVVRRPYSVLVDCQHSSYSFHVHAPSVGLHYIRRACLLLLNHLLPLIFSSPLFPPQTLLRTYVQFPSPPRLAPCYRPALALLPPTPPLLQTRHPRPPKTTTTNPAVAMFATRALRQAAAHAERTPLIKFIGPRSIPCERLASPRPWL